MLQCQAVSKTNGGFSDDIASSMHHAGVVTATDAGVPPPQAVMIVMATYMAWHVLRFFRDVSLRRPVFVGPVQVDPYVAEIMKDPDSPKNFTGRALPESSNPSFLQMFVLWKTSRISRLRRAACLIQRRWMRSWASAWQLARLKRLYIYIYVQLKFWIIESFVCLLNYLYNLVRLRLHGLPLSIHMAKDLNCQPDIPVSWLFLEGSRRESTWVGGHWSYQHWKIHGNVWCWHITSCQDSCIQKSGSAWKSGNF